MPEKQGTISRPWGDDVYPFRLNWSGIQHVEEAIGGDHGIMWVRRRIIEQDCPSRTLRAIIFYGLLGAGMENKKAILLVKRYVEDSEVPLLDNMLLALEIVQEALKPAPGAAAEKKRTRQAKPTSNGASTSDSLSATPTQSASAPPTSGT